MEDDMYSRTGLAISDLHFGSMAGVMARNFRSSTGEIVELNDGQLYLDNCIRDMLGIIPKRLDFIFINGDAVHGLNQKEIALGVNEPDMSYQVDGAYRVLLPFAERASYVFCSAGSEYHAAKWAVWENELAIRLDAEEGPDGRHAPFWRHVGIDGVNFDVAHTQSAMMRYPASSLDRELQFSTMVSDVMELGQTDVVLRSHVHRYMHLNIDGMIGITTPAMCLQTPYAKKSKIPNRLLSRYVGAVIIRIRKKEYALRGPRVEVEPLLYKHPKIKAIQI